MDDLTRDAQSPETAPDAPLARVREWLGAGRQAAAGGDFSSAGAALQQAQRALDGAMPAEADDADLQLLRDEVAEMAVVVGLAEQATAEQKQGLHDRALATLAAAGQRLAHRDEPAIAAAIEQLRLKSAGQQKRGREDEQELAKGERLLSQRLLREAAASFQKAYDSGRQKIRARADTLLRQVEQELQAFEEDSRLAREATDPEIAAAAWQRAYDRWPTGDNITPSLADALTRAGDAVLATGREEHAREYFDRALRMISDHPDAIAGLRQLARAQQIREEIARARAMIDQLTQRGLPVAGDDAELRARLAELVAEAGDLSSLRREIGGLQEELDQRQEHGRTIALADEQAARLAVEGDWDGAVQAHADALGVLGDPLPTLAARRHAAWQDARDTCANASREGARLLELAQAAYEVGRAAGDFAGVIAQTGRIDQMIDAAARRSQTVGVPLPGELRALLVSADVLGRRAEAAEIALEPATVQQGLSSVSEAIRALGEDATLRRIEEELHSERSRQVPDLLLQAQQAEEGEAFGDALDYLRQASEIDPNNPGLAERLEQISRRRRFEELLHRAEVDAEVAGSSLTAARNALRRGLEVFMMPEFAVPETTRATIRNLMALDDQDGSEALAKSENWQRARELRERLLSQQGWADRRAAQITEQWLSVAREAALRGAIASLTQIGDVLGAYRTAFNYRRIYQTEESIDFLERAQDRLRQSLLGQADKLLSRAREALDEGEHASALENLDRLEQDYYGPIQQEFPFLLATLDEYQEITKSRLDAQDLRKQAVQLQQRAAEIKQALDEAERAFLASQFAEAERSLEGIVHDKRLRSLQQFADTLSVRIERSRGQQARRRLDEQRARARTALKTETDHHRLADLLAGMEQFASECDWEALKADDRVAFEALIDQVDQARSNLEAVATWEDEARQAQAAGDYERTARALQQAIQESQDRGRRARLQAELDEIDVLMRRQRNREDALQRGRLLLSKSDYVGAIDAFARAHSFGADVEALQRIARAGGLLDRAKTVWEAKQNLEAARDDLDLAAQLASNNPEAALIAAELAYYHGQVRQCLADIQAALQSARAALNQDDLPAAETLIRGVLAWDTAQPEALRLQAEHQLRAKARADDTKLAELLARIDQERKRGNDRTALTFLEDAQKLRPNDPIVTNLQAELEREHQANEVLRQARSETYNGKFKEAHRLIQIAEEHASPVLLTEVRRLLEDLEAAYRSNSVYPIRDLLRDERYREALRRCTDTLTYVESDYLRADLVDLSATIARRWVDKEIGQAQNQLRGADQESDFIEIAAKLLSLKDELKDFPERLRFDHWVRQANIGRLTLRLENIEAFLRQRVLLYQPGAFDQTEALPADAAIVGPGTLPKAQSQAAEALAEAEAMQLDRLSARARALLSALDERVRFELMQDARLLLEGASGRPSPELADENLKSARELMQAVLQHERFRNDGPAIALRDQIEIAQRSLKQTRDGIGRVEQALANGRFDNAQRLLRKIDAVYPQLKPRYDQLRDLLTLLRHAEDLADKREWRGAIAEYRKAAQQEPALELLQSKIEQCQQRLTEQIVQEARAALRALPPDPASAQSLLDEAISDTLLHPTAADEIARLRKWIASRRRVVEAIGLLDPARAEPERAIELLREAQQLYTDSESEDQVEQWKVLAQALQARQDSNLTAARQLLGQIYPPVAVMPAVRAAQRVVQEQLLAELREQASRALRAWDLKLAGQFIERGLRVAADDAGLRGLSARQQQMGLHSAGLREAMEAGWRALEHVPNASGEDGVAEWRHYQAAQLEFDQALQIDDQFAEAAQWRSFAQAMEQGLRDASQRQYGSAGQSFAEAARALEASAGEPRPAVLGGTKSQQDRRQQATTIAAGLAATAQELGQLVQTYTTRESEPDPNPTEMQRLIRDIRSREQWFKDLSQRSVVPPSDMSKRRSLDTVSQNKTGEIAKETIEPAD